MSDIGAIEVTRKAGNEPFTSGNTTLQFNLLNFWQWSSSDLVGNALRGILAEYIVASAVGSISGVRKEWESFDVLSPEGIKIEVKSGAYIQSWSQKEFSKIQFGIAPKLAWETETNIYSSEKARNADIYVFCVFSNKDQKTVNPLNLDQWDFYVIKAEMLDQSLGEQKSIGLSSLLRLNPIKTCYTELHKTIIDIYGNPD